MIIYTVVKSSKDELLVLFKPRKEMISLDLDPVGLAQAGIQNINWNVKSVTISLTVSYKWIKTGFFLDLHRYSGESRISSVLLSFDLNKINIQT